MAGGDGAMRTGVTFGSIGRAFYKDGPALGYMEETIGLQERLVTRQRRVVEIAAASRMDTGPATTLLRTMEENLAKLHGWRIRLLDTHAAPLPRLAGNGGWRGEGRRATVTHEQRARSRAGAARAAAADR